MGLVVVRIRRCKVYRPREKDALGAARSRTSDSASTVATLIKSDENDFSSDWIRVGDVSDGFRYKVLENLKNLQKLVHCAV
jgi:hypothetical protein